MLEVLVGRAFRWLKVMVLMDVLQAGDVDGGDYISVKTYLCNSRVFRAVGVVEWVVAFTIAKLIFLRMPYKSFRALLQF